MKRGVFFFLLMFFSAAAMSAEGGSITLRASSFYLGGGVGFNSLPGRGSGNGLQILAGYMFDFKLNGDISTALELGYMDTGTFSSKSFTNDASATTSDEAEGVWLNVVETFPIGNRVDGLARLGFDFGDDDGLMAGAGLGYNFNRNWLLRSEYVVRDHTNSLQFNLLYNF